jgi:hypothetical protein
MKAQEELRKLEP